MSNGRLAKSFSDMPAAEQSKALLAKIIYGDLPLQSSRNQLSLPLSAHRERPDLDKGYLRFFCIPYFLIASFPFFKAQQHL